MAVEGEDLGIERRALVMVKGRRSAKAILVDEKTDFFDKEEVRCGVEQVRV